MQSKKNYIMPMKGIVLDCNFYNEKAEISYIFRTLCFIVFVYFENDFVELNSLKIWKLSPALSEVIFIKIIDAKVWLLCLKYRYLDLLLLYFLRLVKSQQRKICTFKIKHKE